MNGISRAFNPFVASVTALISKASDAFKTDNEIGGQFPMPLYTGGWRGYVEKTRVFGPSRSKYQPHHGKRECERRRKQMGTA
jgi:hypothetical protein